jgi:uncharacterized membrane protein
VILAISLGFGLNGAWLIFPFGGLEIAAVYLAFRYVERCADDYECITIHGDQIVIESRRNGRDCRFEFNRYWVRLAVGGIPGEAGGRLVLRSHGKEVEFGVHLTGKQRAAMARRLKEHLTLG